MEIRTETDCTEEIQQIAADAALEAGRAVEADPTMEAAIDPAGDTGIEPSPNQDFCREVIASFCKHHAEGVRSEFVTTLEPIAGSSIATRIADRAAMSPAIQATVADNGAKVLDKYGLAKYINAEAALGAALISYYFELSAARRDRDAILNAVKAQQPQSGGVQ